MGERQRDQAWVDQGRANNERKANQWPNNLPAWKVGPLPVFSRTITKPIVGTVVISEAERLRWTNYKRAFTFKDFSGEM